MRQKCKICGKNSYSEYCWKHKPRKSLKGKVLTAKREEISEESLQEIEKMQAFFSRIWNKRPHVSEISGNKLSSPIRTYYFHHIIEKNTPRLGEKGKYDEENIILLTFEEHEQVGLNPYRYPEINERRRYLIKKYENE